MRVLLVGNYAPDAQQSMLRFGALLLEGLRARGTDARLFAPAARLAPPDRPTFSGVGKWLAYVDKYVLFPPVLRREVRRFRPDVVHVCDHSNGVYVAPARRGRGEKKTPVLVTCHDLGAVRGALGEAAETFCPASPIGKVLQRWIARGLARADHVACDTAATAADVRRLIAGPPPTSVVPLGFQAPYRRLSPAEADARLAAAGIVDPAGGPFLLHVGSGLPRKNREGVLKIFLAMLARWPVGRLVFAGEALAGETAALAARCPEAAGRVISLVNPANETIEALYSRALALVFPSRFEGFGWPVIEAQACGCPVVCGDTPALAETAGEGAFVAGPDEVDRFADHLLRLAADPAERTRWVERGLINAARFDTGRMLDAYVNLYRQLADRAA